MANISFSGKWKDLLAALQTLTPEQLDRGIVAAGEEQLFLDVSLEITTEPHYQDDSHDPYIAESELLAELGEEGRAQLDEYEREEAGAVYLRVI
jgi:hypothetical protein